MNLHLDAENEELRIRLKTAQTTLKQHHVSLKVTGPKAAYNALQSLTPNSCFKGFKGRDRRR